MKGINPLNAELNPICHVLALLEPHHILHVSWIRFNSFIKIVVKVNLYVYWTLHHLDS